METKAQCIFCKIIAKEIPANIVFEDESLLVIKDISPQAPVHLLMLPKKHINNITQFEDAHALGKLMQTAQLVIDKTEISKGFRLVVNTGNNGGQTVDHIHVHVLAGRAMQWPPG
jgi:histidine triad (HIT) family protein